MRALDLFCGGGGASMGLHLAGFEVVGVDINPQKHYPFEFHQADALEFPLDGFDLIWASPPCQAFSVSTPPKYKSNHPNLIPAIRQRLVATGKSYIIENVEGARKHLTNPVMLCGSMFGLPIFRHRYFENNFGLFFSPYQCNHNFTPVLVTGRTARKGQKRFDYSIKAKREAIGIDWMSIEISQAIPPAYSQWLATKFLETL